MSLIRSSIVALAAASGMGAAAAIVATALPSDASTQATQDTPATAVAGSIFTWGTDSYGQTAQNPSSNLLPTELQVPIRQATDVATTSSGTRTYPTLPNAVALSAGNNHSLALLPDGTVLGWGRNNMGQVGIGDNTNNQDPTQVPGITDAIAVSAGEAHSMALRADGTVLAWGYNYNGQVGDGTGGTANQYRRTPVPVVGLQDVAAISAGNSFSVALKKDGTVWVWGKNTAGQLGQGTFGGVHGRPEQVPGLTDVVQIDASDDSFILARKSDGTVWAWGYNQYGMLGDGTVSTNDQKSNPTPTQVKDLTGVVDIAAGSYHSVALKSDHTVWSWGWNKQGQLGIDDLGVELSAVPVKAVDLNNEWDPAIDAVDVEAGGMNTAAIRANGGLVAWGVCNYNLAHNLVVSSNDSGADGCASGKVSANRPMLTWYKEGRKDIGAPLDGVAAVTVGSQHTMVVKTS